MPAGLIALTCFEFVSGPVRATMSVLPCCTATQNILGSVVGGRGRGREEKTGIKRRQESSFKKKSNVWLRFTSFLNDIQQHREIKTITFCSLIQVHSRESEGFMDGRGRTCEMAGPRSLWKRRSCPRLTCGECR